MPGADAVRGDLQRGSIRHLGLQGLGNGDHVGEFGDRRHTADEFLRCVEFRQLGMQVSATRFLNSLTVSTPAASRSSANWPATPLIGKRSA